MTQKEFEDRTKMVVSADEFEVIHDMYMACGDGCDKDEFCDLYSSKVGREDLMRMMAYEHKITEDALRMATAEIEKIKKERRDAQIRTAEWLMEQAEKWSASDLRDKAIEVLGARGYLRRKIEKGMNLWDADRELLVELLSEEE